MKLSNIHLLPATDIGLLYARPLGWDATEEKKVSRNKAPRAVLNSGSRGSVALLTVAAPYPLQGLTQKMASATLRKERLGRIAAKVTRR